jgi:hypothetical protein
MRIGDHKSLGHLTVDGDGIGARRIVASHDVIGQFLDLIDDWHAVLGAQEILPRIRPVVILRELDGVIVGLAIGIELDLMTLCPEPFSSHRLNVLI